MTRKSYSPYGTELPNLALQLLSSQAQAEHVLTQWLLTQYKPMSELSKSSYNPNFTYAPDRLLEFKTLNGYRLTNPGNVKFWTGVANLYQKLASNEKVLTKLGCQMVKDEGTLRLQVAYALEMYSYAIMSSKMSLFSPCAVVWILLTSRTEQAVSFRKFLGVNYAKPAFYPRKLYMNLKEFAIESKENANV